MHVLLFQLLLLQVYVDPKPIDVFLTDENKNSLLSSPEAITRAHGFLWVGNHKGLFRFDGYSFVAYDHRQNDPRSLISNHVTSLTVDVHGLLLVGTHRGLTIFNPEEERFTPISIPTHPKIECLLALADGSTLIGGNGLFKMNRNGEISIINGSLQVMDLKTDAMGRAWVLTNASIYSLEGDTLTLAHEHSQSVFVKMTWAGGRLWLGGMTGGLWQFDPATASLTEIPPIKGLIDGAFVGLVTDGLGQVWFGTRVGLGRIDPKSGTLTRFRTNLNSNGTLNVESLFWESEMLWIGLKDFGLSRLDLNALALGKVNHFQSEDKEYHNEVVDTVQDNEGNIWVATPETILRYDEDSGLFQSLAPDLAETLKQGIVITALFDQENRLWAGTHHLGLLRLEANENSWTSMNLRHSNEGSPSVYSLLQRQNGDIWVGMMEKGAYMIPSGTDKPMAHKSFPENSEALPDGYILYLDEDQNQNLWLCSYGGGLVSFNDDTDTFSRYTSASHGLVSDFVVCVKDDALGRLWVGSNGGLSVLLPGQERFSSITKEHGLPDDTIYGILPDPQNNVWLSTSKGLLRYFPETERFQQFKSGLLTDDDYNTGAFLSLSDGRFIFGGNGFNLFDPMTVPLPAPAGKPILTNLSLYNKPVSPGEKGVLERPVYLAERVTLQHDQRVFSIEFASTTGNPEQTQYAYRLAPFDQDWLYTNALHRIATYTNLPSDIYQFQVKATDNASDWSVVNQKLKIHIEPPFWQTRTAISIYFLLVVGGVLAFLAYQRHLRRVLERLVSIRTKQLVSTHNEAIESAHAAGMSDLAEEMLHQLGNRLNSIKTSTQSLRESVQKDRPLRMLERLIHRFRETDTPPEMGQVEQYLDKVRHTLNLQLEELDKESGHLDTQIQEISGELLHQQKYFRKNDLQDIDLYPLLRIVGHKQYALFQESKFKIHLPNEQSVLVLGHPTRLSLALSSIFQNAIEALPVTGGNIWIQLEKDEVYIRLTISDDGVGVPEEHLDLVWQEGYTSKPERQGRGLHYCANVIREMQGNIEFVSKGEGKGAEVSIWLMSKESASVSKDGLLP